jgi:dTDP-4-amino-4,6-dideoxygalactose transaminase
MRQQNSGNPAPGDGNEPWIPLHRPDIGSQEREAVAAVISGGGRLAGDGPVGRRLEVAMAQDLGAAAVLLAPSGTAALELAMLMLDLRGGDEVIVPSFTFASTVNAILLRGARPRWAEIDAGTMTLDPDDVARRIGPRTRAILPIHYQGLPCDLDRLGALAADAGIPLVEDAAQACGARWAGRSVGAVGTFGCLSFHETKSLTCGEGGAIVLTRDGDVARAQESREKGTNRAAFLRGDVPAYDWVRDGQSCLLAEPLAAMLEVQWARAEALRGTRQRLWFRYHDAFAPLEVEGRLLRPHPLPSSQPSWEGYFVLFPTASERDAALAWCHGRGVGAAFHHRPLHCSPRGLQLGVEDLPRTSDLAARLLRLPLFPSLVEEDQERVVDAIATFCRGGPRTAVPNASGSSRG